MIFQKKTSERVTDILGKVFINKYNDWETGKFNKWLLKKIKIRLDKGHEKYKDSWKTKMNLIETQEELLDALAYLCFDMLQNKKSEPCHYHEKLTITMRSIRFEIQKLNDLILKKTFY